MLTSENMPKVIVEVIKRNYYEVIAVPKCDNAYRFCLLMKRNFFTDKELYIIGKLGFVVINLKEIESASSLLKGEPHAPL